MWACWRGNCQSWLDLIANSAEWVRLEAKIRIYNSDNSVLNENNLLDGVE